MKIKSLYIMQSLFQVLSALLFTVSFSDLGLGQEDIIAGVEIKGNRRIETELIRTSISSRAGEPLSRDTVREDIKRIYQLGFFEDVSAEVEKTSEGLVLTYSVKEKPIIVDLRIRGNKDIQSEKILDVMEIREGRIIELQKVSRSVDAINKLYASEGFIETEVDYNIEPRAEGAVSVTFDITEGKRAYIKEVDFIGNENVKGKEIEKVIYSKPTWLLTFVTKRGLYRKDEIERDADRIRALYLDKGYLDIKVSQPEAEYSEEKDGFVVTFRIEEGNQYKVGNIRFEGDLIEPEEELEKLIQLESGDVLSRGILAGDIAKLTTFYGDKGYAFANIEPQFQIDKNNLTADIQFSIEKGEKVYIRRIDIVGNRITRDKVIRRELPIEEEELFSATKIQRIKPRVFRLGFFEENVEVATEPVPDAKDKIDVSVKVKEKPTGFFSVAGGFSSVETFIFAGQIEESNLFGFGKQLNFSAQIGGVTRLFLLNYQDPYFLDTNFTLDILGFNTKRQYRDFDRDSYGGSIGFGRRLTSNLIGRLSYRYENIDTGDVPDGAEDIIEEGKIKVSSIGLNFTWDTRNNIIDPTRGNISRTAVEFADSALGGDTDFTRFTASTRFFFPFVYNTVISLAGRYGIIDFRNVGDELIVSERFFLGGPDSLRGYEYRRVSPRVFFNDGDDFVLVGGTQEILFTAEYIFPLLPQAGLKGVVFYDIGNAYGDDNSLSFIDFGDLKQDVGLGFRWASPLGPLRLEVGFPLGNRLSDEDAYEIQFTIGTLF
ncbi:MAG TPA: outer membrane protein assembly factor BamA [Thermodesulfobacteriota bacterium]|nr:outer membrane protein assembly factor BamA [Thermodesulfobacteriota bacterium]